jgi:hypothetical protein
MKKNPNIHNFSIHLQINKRVISALVLASILGFLGLNHTLTKASTSSLSGKCGMLINRSFFGFEAAQYNQSGQVPNTLAYFDFDNGTSQMANATISNFGLNSATAAPGNSVINAKFTQAAGPVTGSFTLTLGNITLNVLPVNAGNTFLIQIPGNGTQMSPATGVCQKI